MPARVRWLAVLTAAALGAALWLPPCVAAQMPPADTRCRAGLGKGVAKLTKLALRAQATCHLLVARGALPPETDCDSPGSSPIVARAGAVLQRLAVRRCALAAPPAALGYGSCPVACSGPAADYPAVADCLACAGRQWLAEAGRTAHGVAGPVANADARACLLAIGKALQQYLLARMRDQQRCQLADDRSALGVDCRTIDSDGSVARARAQAEQRLHRCSNEALAALDSCATEVAAAQRCVIDVAELHADQLFNAVYRPYAFVPTATPSPTATPVSPTLTATGTATASAPPTATSSATTTISATPTSTVPPPPTPTRTPSVTATASATASATSTVTSTVTGTATRTATSTRTAVPSSTPTALPPVHIDVTPFPGQSIAPCLIFVHGKRTNPGTYTDWNQARDYWRSGADDFIRTATKNFAASYYVVGYNGTQPYWHEQAAGELANEIVNATTGGDDDGGNHCARTYAEGGTFWLIGHSMGASLIDFVLGNADPNDPNYNYNGPYDVAAERISLAISVAGTHRGSQGADLVCGQGNPFCSFFAQFIQSCDAATYWLRSADDVQVRFFTSTPAKTVWLTGGYAAIIGASACLSGEDDGLVQHASAYACDGSATAAYDNQNLCGNASKQKASGFMNLDAAHENHDQSRNDSHAHTRVAIPDGIWVCNGQPCGPGSTVNNALSTADFISRLY